MSEQLARQDYWNVGYPSLGAIVYFLLLVGVMAVACGLYRRYRLWRLGRPSPDMGPWRARLGRAGWDFLLDLLGHRRFIRGELCAGLAHLLLFWGAALLVIATVLTALEFNWDHYLARPTGLEFPTSRYRLQTGLVWDVGGLIAAVGVGMAAWRRYLARPERLTTVLDDGVILGLIAGLIVTGFALEGLRIGATVVNPSTSLYAPSQAWLSPGGSIFALIFRGLGATPHGLEVAHFSLWWLHSGLVGLTFLYVGIRPSRLRHILLGPLNVLLRPARHPGRLQNMGDLDAAERFGARDAVDFTWKHLLDWDACTNCGRCQDRCPAWLSGKSLSPRRMMQDLSEYLEKGEGRAAHDVAKEEALWACTTCGACSQTCPVAVQPLDSIVEMRRYLAMEEVRMPQPAREALLNLEQRGHPWRGTPFGRMDWTQGMGVRTLAEHPDAGLLLWIGCTVALDQRSQGIARAAVKVLGKAGVDFAVLGEEETCTGDPARRLGNEYLFQLLARRNIETFERYGVRRIVTLCPHCYNTFRNEYPQLGGSYEVMHYTQLVDRLLAEGRLRLSKGAELRIAYHDACYLGRHNGVYKAPRRILGTIPGVRLVEMSPHHGRESLCCGAGGGHMWIEERADQRVAQIRLAQFDRTGADTLAVSCPFCLQMLGAELGDGSRSVCDVLEVLAQSLDGAQDTQG